MGFFLVYLKKNKMRTAYLAGLLLGFLTTSFAQNSNFIIPEKQIREIVLHHKAYSLSYNTSYVLPSWVSYKVTNSNIDKSVLIKGKYIPNPQISSRSASKKDYKDSGYLMGQLVNSLDIMHIDGALEESFYMSNIVPMKLAFHKHMWLKTEDLIRLWLRHTDELYIVCAPILKDGPFKTFGKGKVSNPKRFYKIVYDKQHNQAIGFIFKNGVSSGSLKSYTHSIEKIEQETGINFFPEMPAEEAKSIKGKVDYDFWKFEIEKVKY